MKHQFLTDLLKDDLGPAQMRVLTAVVELGELSDGNTTISSDANTILGHIEGLEGKQLSNETLRKRLQLINQAADNMSKPLFRIMSRTSGKDHRIVISLSDEGVAKLKSQTTFEQVKLATSADTNIDPADHIDPQLIKPEYQVFVSHAHENGEVEQIVKEFCQALEQKLRYAPEPFCDRFEVKLWLDHFNMAGQGEFSSQTDIQCKKSSLGIFLLSDRWHHRKPEKLHRR